MTEGSRDLALIALATDQVSLEFPVNAGVTRSLGHHRVVHAVTEGVVRPPQRIGPRRWSVSPDRGNPPWPGFWAGLYRPTRGEVHLEGSAVDVRSPQGLPYLRQARPADPAGPLRPH